jgi:Zn-dependent protease
MFITVIFIVFIAVPSIVLHEVAHGWVASRLGDDTALRMGRLTLNPLKHVDPIGTIAVPAALYLIYALGWTSSLVMFGWAKPVPVNFNRLRSPRRDMLLVAIAGPVTNILIAFVLAQMMRFGILPGLAEIFFYAILLNLALAIFNLIPIPPLDGSRVVSSLLPDDLEKRYSRLEPYGLLIVVILLNLGWLKFMNVLIYGAMRLMGL